MRRVRVVNRATNKYSSAIYISMHKLFCPLSTALLSSRSSTSSASSLLPFFLFFVPSFIFAKKSLFLLFLTFYFSVNSTHAGMRRRLKQQLHYCLGIKKMCKEQAKLILFCLVPLRLLIANADLNVTRVLISRLRW